MKRWGCLALVFLALTGCSKKEKMTGKDDFLIVEDEKISVAAGKLLFYGMEKQENESHQVYSEDFWDVVIDMEDNLTYAEYEKEVHFQEQNLHMLALASLWEQKNDLSTKDHNTIQLAARTYMDSMNEKDRELLEITEEDMISLFEIYYKAAKMEESYISSWNESISEEEYRVALVQKDIFVDETHAMDFLSKIEQGNSPEALTKYVNQTMIINVNQSTKMDAAAKKAIFSLKKGECSSIIRENDGYVVYVMLDVFQNDLSMLRKDEIIAERKKQAWQKTCDNFLKTAKVLYREEAWASLQFSSRDEYSDDIKLVYKAMDDMVR